MSLDRQSKLAVTLGDPAGIGPEVILKALADPAAALKVTVLGSRIVLQQTYDQLRSSNPAAKAANPETLNIIDIEPDSKWGEIVPGVGSAASGAASFAYMESAIARTIAGEFSAIVTARFPKLAGRPQVTIIPDKQNSSQKGQNRSGSECCLPPHLPTVAGRW